MKDVVKNLYDILSGARRLGKDLMKQLGMDSEEIGMVTEPLDIIIGH
jgi:hypothetical protein